MNLLSLTGALLTASASVLNNPIKVNHQNKMMDVEYKYESNEVNSYTDVVVGNIYEFDFQGNYLYDYFDGSITIQLITNLSYYFESFDDSYVISDREYNLEANNIVYFIEDKMGVLLGSYDDYLVADCYYQWVGYTDSAFIGKVLNIDYYHINSNDLFIHYTDYNEIVPSTNHRGNLYTTIYDFFYGIFDTSDTNELSMTIMGQNMNMTSWLAHTVTIALLLLGVLWLILVIRWIFRVFSGLVKI